MSHKLISHNSDLQQLLNEGYEIEIKHGYLLVHHIPYVNAQSQIKYGVLVCALDSLSGEKTGRPQTHVIYFQGEHPCDMKGNLITGIKHATKSHDFGNGITASHSFSNKPPKGYYDDYHAKISTYATIITSQAQALDPKVSARTYRPITSPDSETPFQYLDTNSTRGEISAISQKLEKLKIAIIGLGGTGSYVLDFVAKTPVSEIHLYDADNFSTHNAFRSPGAASIDTLNSLPSKVSHLLSIYSNMHRGVIPHEYYLDAENLHELTVFDFVFICIDEGAVKKLILEKLIETDIPWVDTGIGVEVTENSLTGSIRTTAAHKEKHDHVGRRISFAGAGDDEYSTNIQIAELNALNAALAVIKWKKIFGFYCDDMKEHHSVYNFNANYIINEDSLS